ncbi:MAG TPA: hypothetical protein VKB25_03750 [Conexibacter sp.]|nr:hypothetical protein [Conexibacter sp.]
MHELGLSRRELLLRTGVLGAGAVAAGVWPSMARGGVPEALEPLLERIAEPALQLLAHDTYAGLAVFAVPGPDVYSNAQRLTSATPGPIEARAPELLMHTLDRYLSLPDDYLQALAAAFRTGVSDVRIPHTLLGGALAVLELVGATMDDALRLVLQNDRNIPASLPLALMMNFAATQVRPSSVVGPIPSSPFANLTWSEKGLAFQRIEQADPTLVALIDANAPQPLREGASGLLRFAGNVMLTLAAFAPYTEFGVFDRGTLRATRRPIGWDLSNYMPGRTTPADGWPELIGYYQDRRAVQTAPEYSGGA